MKDILTAPFMRDIMDTSDNMYRMGWNERNAGNITMLLDEEQLTDYLDLGKVKRSLPLSQPVPDMGGRYLVVTGSGKFFRNTSRDPENCLAIVKIHADGAGLDILWGFNDGGKCTSEMCMHLCAHNVRLKIDPNQRVVTHAHPQNLVTMSHLHTLDEREFTRSLWKTCAEGILVFPDGVAVLPWMVNGNDTIGMASAEKFKDTRLLVWSMHGVTATGSSLDETVGLLEVVEKAAGIYLTCLGHERVNLMTDEMLKENCAAFGTKYREGWLD